eukprot:SAG31_NODE_3364_length_4360_cov_2.281155_2_plen_43_part_00
MGLPGYGVARKDMSSGEILIPLTVPDRGNAGGKIGQYNSSLS